MVATLTDPRQALSLRRARLQITITRQRAALKELGCGCSTGACAPNAAAHALMLGQIHNNLLELDDLTDAITDCPMLS
jgi:hypothetical protein